MRTKVLILIIFSLSLVNLLNAQCGFEPTSGVTSISVAAQIPNSYYAGQGSAILGNSFITIGSIDPRGNSTPLASGDLVLLIQMQGADISSVNSSAYGDGVNGGVASGYLTSNLVAGNYEYNSVAGVAGSTITLTYPLANNYFSRAFSFGAIQTFQLIRIPRAFGLTITAAGTVTCPAWNGSTGGVIVLDAVDVMTIDGNINASGLGFRGGGGINLTGALAGNTNGSGTLTNTDLRWNSPVTNPANLTGGAKGEGISGTPTYLLSTGSVTIDINTDEGYTNGSMGRGAPGNAGGGATDGSPVGSTTENQYNPAGGGGANGGAGGQGGSGWHGGAGNAGTYPTGGYGGSFFLQTSSSRFVMGGGGGAGTANNSTSANQYMSSGGAGGGIILLRAKSYTGAGTISANGGDAVGVTGGGGNTDAAGGGGGGGVITAVTRTNTTVGLTNITAIAKGGKGGNMETYYDHGPGGGGGGGIIITNGTFSSINVNGGANGLTRTGSPGGPIDNPYGASPGGDGVIQILASAPALQNASNLSSPCGVLPITLESFTAVSNGSSVLLSWKIGAAIQFSHFDIEYSDNGSNFSSLGQVAFNAAQVNYQYTHSPVIKQTNFYRLKMVNMDGSYHYSQTLLVKMGNISPGIKIYPQPATNTININVTAIRTQNATIQIFNTAGAKVKEDRVQLVNGNNSFVIENLASLSPGVYTLKTMIDEKIVVSKLIIAGNR